MDDLMNVNNEFSLFGVTFPDPWATLIRLALIIVIGMILIKILLTVLRHVLKKIDSLDDMLNKFVTNAVRVICIIILVAIALDTLGVNIGTIVAVLGAAGAAIALALKDSLANIAGGLMVIITHPFKRGDLINIGQYRGRVQEIDLFLTTLRTLNYQTITIPNGLVNTSILVNESREEIRRVDLTFAISYDSDVARAKEILRQVCREAELVLDDREPGIGVNRNDDSAVVLDLMAWCRTEDYFKTEYYLLEQVKLAFDKAGIQIPYPHMVVETEKKE
ncbi:MAG: mechanosensitive ion channel family protein [Firmicutes bacterium]|nr:mechanosensitive ion channel family protein [Bacillota bacterium]